MAKIKFTEAFDGMETKCGVVLASLDCDDASIAEWTMTNVNGEKERCAVLIENSKITVYSVDEDENESWGSFASNNLGALLVADNTKHLEEFWAGITWEN